MTSSCGTGRRLGALLLLGRGAQAQNGQLTLNCNSDAVARFSAMAKLAVSGSVGGEVAARAAESPGAGVKSMQEWQLAWLKCGESTCIFDGRELDGRVLCAARDGGKWPVYIFFDLRFAPCFCLCGGRFGGGPIFGFVAIWFILHFLPWPPLISGGGFQSSCGNAPAPDSQPANVASGSDRLLALVAPGSTIAMGSCTLHIAQCIWSRESN